MTRHLGSALLSTVSTLALSAAACVATNQAATAQETQQVAFEQIIVTGERRAQSLQRVPSAVAAVTSAQILNSGVQQLSDLQNVTPSLSVVDGPAGRYINIRGVGYNTGNPQSVSGVPLHIDGMYIPRQEILLRDAYVDLERIEVYRGPQGTFAGQNSDGGAMFIIAKQPQFDAFDAHVMQSFGNYSWLQSQAVANLPISDHLAARVALNYETKNSFYSNYGPLGAPGTALVGYAGGVTPLNQQGSKNQPGNLDRKSMRAILRYEPSDKLEFRLRYDHLNENTDGEAYRRGIPGSFNDASFLDNPAFNSGVGGSGDPRAVAYDHEEFNTVKMDRAILNASWKLFDAIEIKSVTGAQNIDQQTSGDGDATSPYIPQPAFSAGGITEPAFPNGYVQAAPGTFQRNHVWYQEIDLVSTYESPLQWVIGAVGLKELLSTFTVSPNYNQPPGVPPPTATFQKFYPPATGGSWLDYRGEHEAAAFFGEARYRLGDRFEFIAGGRWTYDRSALRPGSTIYNAAPPNGVANSCPIPVGPCNVQAAAVFHAPTGRVAFNWYASEKTMLYATYSLGFKPGGYQTQFTLQKALAPGQSSLPPFKSETVRNYEAGIKTTIMDGRMMVNLDGFYEDFRDYQANFTIVGTPIPRVYGIPKSQIYGAEAQIGAHFGDLAWNLNLTYSHSEVLSTGAVQTQASDPTQLFFTPGIISPGNPAPGTVFNPKGKPLNYSPEWTVNTSLDYDIDLGDGTLTPHIQYAFVGEQWAQLFHVSQDKIPEHGVLDLRLAYKAPEHWRVEAYVTNVTDELYVSGVSQATSGTSYVGLVSLGAPREFGARISYDY